MPGKPNTTGKYDTPASVEKDNSDTQSEVLTSDLGGAPRGIEDNIGDDVLSGNATQRSTKDAVTSVGGTVPKSNVQQEGPNIDDTESAVSNFT